MCSTKTGTVQDKGGKEFYTIKTKSDKVFYLIVDKDKTDENVYLLTGSHDLIAPCFTLITRRITLGNLVWLATGCKVLLGICLADGVVASDASLIRKNVELSLEVTLPNSLRIEN